MAIIRDQIIDYSKFNRDGFLRNTEAPAFSDDPVTFKEIRGGIEVISRSGNVMPRAITRDKLGEDALLIPLNFNLTPANVIQVATGYDRALNNFVYSVEWNTIDFFVRRFNTLDLLSPYQDGFSVNLPFVPDDVFGGAINDEHVIVAVDGPEAITGGNPRKFKKNKIVMFDFDLVHEFSLFSTFPYEDNLGIRENFTFNGEHLVAYKDAEADNLVIDSKSEDVGGNLDLNSRPAIWQTFTTGPKTTKIKRIDVHASNSANGVVAIRLKNADGSVTLLEGQMLQNFSKNWHSSNVDITVTPNTVYRLELEATVGGGIQSWSFSSADNYPGGSAGGSVIVSGRDMAFRIFTEIANRNTDRLEFYDLDTVNGQYNLDKIITWPSGTTKPLKMMMWDQKFYYGYNPSTKTIIKFTIQNDQVVVASEQFIQETVQSMLFFNNFVYIVYPIGTSLLAVPVSI